MRACDARRAHKRSGLASRPHTPPPGAQPLQQWRGVRSAPTTRRMAAAPTAARSDAEQATGGGAPPELVLRERGDVGAQAALLPAGLAQCVAEKTEHFPLRAV